MFGAMTSLQITCLSISLRNFPKKDIIVRRKNTIDCFVIAEVGPIFLRDLAGNRGHLEGYAGKIGLSCRLMVIFCETECKWLCQLGKVAIINFSLAIHHRNVYS